MPVAYLAGYGAGSRSMLKISAPTLRDGSAATAHGARMGELFPAYEPLAAKVSLADRA